MSDLVRVRVGDYEKNVGRALAEADGLQVLDEPTRDRTGQLRPATRVNGRPLKPRTTVAKQAAKKARRPAAPKTSAQTSATPGGTGSSATADDTNPSKEN